MAQRYLTHCLQGLIYLHEHRIVHRDVKGENILVSDAGVAKLCDMAIGDGNDEPQSLASILCIAIHRTTVKNSARTLENLAKAIQEDPVKGSAQRVKDARVALLTIDVVRAVKLISPFVFAYKSVSKRRQLPWDPNMGEDAGELDSFIRFLVMRLVNSLKGKALNYTKNSADISQARSSMFMMNNTFYLRDELGPRAHDFGAGEDYRIESSLTTSINTPYNKNH